MSKHSVQQYSHALWAQVGAYTYDSVTIFKNIFTYFDCSMDLIKEI
jgi:hypothetical protein